MHFRALSVRVLGELSRRLRDVLHARGVEVAAVFDRCLRRQVVRFRGTWHVARGTRRHARRVSRELIVNIAETESCGC